MLCIALAACAETPTIQSDLAAADRTDSSRVVRVDSTHTAFHVDTLARDLEVPWAIAPLPDGRLLVTERTGRVVLVHPELQRQSIWATIDVYAQDPGIGPETGLMGIAIPSDFATTKDVFLVATTWRSAGDRHRSLPTRLWRRLAALADETAALRYENQVLRFRDSLGRGTYTARVIDKLPTAYYHAGGGLAFGPDGHLYLTQGDAMLPDLVAGRRSTLARVLRYARNGTVPADNPTAGDPTWATGLRNAQALAWLPDSTLLVTEHGPSGMPQESGRRGHDELNLVPPGADFGWPRSLGADAAPGVTRPLFTWRDAIAPAGVALYQGPVVQWHGSVIVAGLRGSLERLQLARLPGGWGVVARQQLFGPDAFGRLRAVAVDNKGRILITTSNRDVRGIARRGDDLLVRLTPLVAASPPRP